MEKVLGIGGFFFRSTDPKKLARWYADHLGVTEVPTDYDTRGWHQAAGATVFAPFEKDTEYFQDSEKNWMINFRVRDLGAITAQLRASGIEVEIDKEIYPNGKFARLTDPEGNPIQLWEPSSIVLDAE